MRKVIFKKVTLKKKNFYTWLKEILTEAGWENISSKPSTDFDVFYSKGESGKDELYFQMKEYPGNTTNESLSASNERFLEIKLLKGYIPGEPGISGKWNRPNESFRRILIANTLINTESDMFVYYNVNKNRVVIMLEYPIGLTAESSLFMIGKSDKQVSKVYADGAMMYFATTSVSGTMVVVDEADSTLTASNAVNTYENLTPKFRNTNRKVFFSELVAGSAREGFRGSIDGVYVGSVQSGISGPALKGDLLVDKEGNTYRIFYLDTRLSYYDYYTPTRYMALMIEEGEGENG